MAHGRLEPPNLDDRVWQDIVDEAKALIPRYNPEWTDHNPSDLGITLVELFAWLVEGMIYRMNRVPDKNFIEFLNLLGITRDPASPATTYLTYKLANIVPTLLLPQGNQAATQQTDRDTAVVFETDAPVQLLPINLTTALSVKKLIVFQYKKVTSSLVAAPLSGMAVNIPTAQANTLLLGFDQATAQSIMLRFQFTQVANPGDLQVQWAYSQAALAPAAWPLIPGALDGTNHFTQNGQASFTVPANWTAQAPPTWANPVPESLVDTVQQPLFWIGIRISNLLAVPYQLQLDWVLFNSVHATSALTITTPEKVGTSNGRAFQFFDLKQAPLFRRPGVPDPYDHLALQVRSPLVGGAFGPWVTWTRVENFAEGAGNVYRLDPVTGRINFGNHDPVVSPEGHGTIPPDESEIQALSYRYVGAGGAANVPPGTITVLRTPLAGLTGVTNPGSAQNGANEESVEDAKRRGPEALRNRYRAVTVEDYEYLGKESSTDVAKVRCLAPRQFTTYDQAFNGLVTPGDPWTYGGLNRDTGNVHVLVIPPGPLTNRIPSPSAELLEQITDYLEERRSVTAALNVSGPRYLPIKVTAQIKVWRKAVDTGLVPDPAASNQVRDDIIAKVKQFLHPTLGGPEGTGWEMGEDQTIAPLFEFIKPPSEVGFIASLQLEALTPLYTPAVRLYPVGAPGVWIKFADYEMVCSAEDHAITVQKI
jgi:hypothetical protein